MKVAIIGASYLQLPLYLKAKEMGIETVGFAWEEGAVAKGCCGTFYPLSIVEKDEILQVCLREKIDGILTIASDVAVTTVNYVAENMGLTGNSILSASYSTNKFLMRQCLQNAGVSCPAFFPVGSVTELEVFEQNLSYPLIVKPVDRSGSKGVSKVHDFESLQRATSIALEASLSGQAIVEGFVDGVEVSVEIISCDGLHYPLAITDKETSGSPHFVELAHHQPSQLDAKVQQMIFEAAMKGLDALGIRFGASHSEFIISKGGIFITEIGARMGGDFIGSDLVFLSTGYDFLKGVLDVALNRFEIPILNKPAFSGVYFYSESTPKVLDIIKENGKYPFIVQSELHYENTVPLTQSSDRSGYFIYKSNHKIEI